MKIAIPYSNIALASMTVGFASESFPWAIATFWVLSAIFSMIYTHAPIERTKEVSE